MTLQFPIVVLGNDHLLLFTIYFPPFIIYSLLPLPLLYFLLQVIPLKVISLEMISENREWR